MKLDFDPDKLIGGVDIAEGEARAVFGSPENLSGLEEETNPEAILHDLETLGAPVEGLEKTQQGFEQLENGNTIFDSPFETGEKLNSWQGTAVPRFAGTCGLASAENIARIAGKDVSEADVIAIACKNKGCDHHFWWPAEANGGTRAADICNVLGHLGIEASYVAEPAIDKLADVVESGRGVIALVDVAEFWPDIDQEGHHAVAVTSVERNPDGDVAAFYVCDSGRNGEAPCRRIDAGLFENSLEHAVVTDNIIR